MTTREVVGAVTVVVAAICSLALVGLFAYMFYLGPTSGWLSDRFLDVEVKSFYFFGGLCICIVILGILEKETK